MTRSMLRAGVVAAKLGSADFCWLSVCWEALHTLAQRVTEVQQMTQLVWDFREPG